MSIDAGPRMSLAPIVKHIEEKTNESPFNPENDGSRFADGELHYRSTTGEDTVVSSVTEYKEKSKGRHLQEEYLELNNYGYKSTDTATTLTTYSNSSLSDSRSKDSYSRFSKSSLKSSYQKSAGDLYDEFDSLSHEYHSNFLPQEQPTQSVRLTKKVSQLEKRSSVKDDMPRIPRSPATSSIHSRLAESMTKSFSSRREENRSRSALRQRDTRPPFYTVARANSFSDSSVSSFSTLTSNRVFSEGKVSSSFHSRLAASDTFSSYMKKNQRREDFSATNQIDNWRPFYTTVGASEPSMQNFSRSSRRMSLPRSTERSRESQYMDRCTDNILPKFQNIHLEEDKFISNMKNRKRPSTADMRQSVYDRLFTQGTASSLSRNRKSLQYKEEKKTLHEHCKTALMRDFKGSTHVPVTRGSITKSVIGSVINCG